MMITLPAIFLVAAVATIGVLTVFSISYFRGRTRQQDRLETAFNRARYVRGCRGNS